MPITYEVDRVGGLIRDRWVGPVTAADLRMHWRTQLADAEATAVRRLLADVREADLQFDGQELFEIVARELEPRVPDQAWKIAILVADDLQFGVSRQFQALGEAFSRDAIFHGEAEALAWLQED